MIASEGPLMKNHMYFWKMLVQENVTKLVSLFEDNLKHMPSSEKPII
jgi:hypothetical protein